MKVKDDSLSQKKDNSGVAIVSFGLGIFSLCVWFLPVVALLIPVLGLILGIISKDSSRRGLAINGIVLNVIGIVLNIVPFLLILIMDPYTFFGTFFTVITLAWPAFILPLIVGPILLIKFRDDDLSRAAGWLTLKPVLATFLWALIFVSTDSTEATYYLTLLPGVILTLIIAFSFRHLFKSETLIFSMLLLLDAIRWTITFVMFGPWLEIPIDPVDPEGLLYLMALIIPNFYATLSLIIGIFRARRSKISDSVSVV